MKENSLFSQKQFGWKVYFTATPDSTRQMESDMNEPKSADCKLTYMDYQNGIRYCILHRSPLQQIKFLQDIEYTVLRWVIKYHQASAQGSELRSLLFVIFINDLPDVVNSDIICLQITLKDLDL